MDKQNTGALPITRVLAASVLLVSVILGLGAWFDYTQIKDASLQRVTSGAFLMEAHAIGTLDAADQVLQRSIDLIGDRRLDELHGDRGFWVHLRTIADSQPVVVMLRLLDADGETVLETTNFPSERINLAGGAYFQEPRNGASLYVGAAVIDPTLGTPVFTLSRRIEDRDGGFRGVVLAALDTTHFNRVYRAIGPRQFSAAGLIEVDDGNFLAREPGWGEFIGRTIGPWESFITRQEIIGPGLFKATSPIDGVQRYYAYRHVDGYPLVVFAGESMGDVREQWYRNIGSMAAGSLLGIAGILYVGRSARRGWRRLRNTSQELQETNARLEQTVADKDMLFREVHHRVKNSLQVIGHLLLLQAQRVHDPAAKAAFQETMDRVQSVASVHHILYRTDQAVEIELDRYLSELCASLAASYGARERGIELRVEASPCRVHVDQAIPLALIVNEAVTNAFKYAFPNGGGGALTLTLSCTGDDLHMAIIDNGVGLPEGATAGDSLGMSLINSLAEQLDGRHEWHPGDGVHLEIVVPLRPLHRGPPAERT